MLEKESIILQLLIKSLTERKRFPCKQSLFKRLISIRKMRVTIRWIAGSSITNLNLPVVSTRCY